jgi:hypothetical protein
MQIAHQTGTRIAELNRVLLCCYYIAELNRNYRILIYLSQKFHLIILKAI